MQGAVFSGHFGGATHFRLIDVSRETKLVLHQADVQAPEHVPGAFPKWLAAEGVQGVIVSGIGKRAVELFTAEGIPVFVAKEGASPAELVALQLDGNLAQANLEQCCPGHQHEGGDAGHASHCH